MIIKGVSNTVPLFFLEILERDHTTQVPLGEPRPDSTKDLLDGEGKLQVQVPFFSGHWCHWCVPEIPSVKRYRYGGLEVPPEEFPKWMQGTYTAPLSGVFCVMVSGKCDKVGRVQPKH